MRLRLFWKTDALDLISINARDFWPRNGNKTMLKDTALKPDKLGLEELSSHCVDISGVHVTFITYAS